MAKAKSKVRRNWAKSQRLQQRADEVVARLEAEYPTPECALHFETPFQLLIATILSAQCTDERVNLVTHHLFAKFANAAALARASQPVVEKLIQSAGFFRVKAKNIIACATQLVKLHRAEVPQELEQLVILPGVGRKTANVVLGTAYGIPTGVVVDTHVTRVSFRLGLTSNTDAVKIERDLMELIPREEWILYSHRVIHHGRGVCKARKPLCASCVLRDICPQVGVESIAERKK